MADVTIAIPTFRRPRGLARLLQSLAELQTAAAVRILVGDNDAEQHLGKDLCEATARAGYRWPLEAIIVRDRGIAQNRSALVARALSRPGMDSLAMLDDDEWVEPGWLDALLATRDRFNADAVEGPVIPIDDNGVPDESYGGVATHRGASAVSTMLQGAGNILIARGILERMTPPYFDPQFALSGGEDKDFFHRLKALGARFAWAAEAMSYTKVPETRSGLKWALSRAYGNGNSDMRIFLKHTSGPVSLVLELAKITGVLIVSPVLTLLLLASPTRRLTAMRKFFRAAGKAAALFGRHHQEYAVIHGE